MRRIAGAVLGLLAVLAPPDLARSLTVSLVPSFGAGFSTQALGGGLGEVSEEVVQAQAIPYVNTSLVTYRSTTTTVSQDLSDRGFRVSFDYSPGAGSIGGSQSSGQFAFSVDQDTAYQAAGWLTAADPGSHSLGFTAALHDNFTDSFVFLSSQDSFSTANESFVLGESDGDFHNQSVGVLSGTLIAGRTYEFYYDAGLYGTAAPYTSGVSASGQLSLLLPEPGIAFFLLLTVVLGAGRVSR